MPTEESYMNRQKRKQTGSVARKKKREKINKELGNMGIFKELKKDQTKRSQE